MLKASLKDTCIWSAWGFLRVDVGKWDDWRLCVFVLNMTWRTETDYNYLSGLHPFNKSCRKQPKFSLRQLLTKGIMSILWGKFSVQRTFKTHCSRLHLTGTSADQSQSHANWVLTRNKELLKKQNKSDKKQDIMWGDFGKIIVIWKSKYIPDCFAKEISL